MIGQLASPKPGRELFRIEERADERVNHQDGNDGNGRAGMQTVAEEQENDARQDGAADGEREE